MRRYVFSAVLFICAASVLSGCGGILGGEVNDAIFDELTARVEIEPDEGEYPFCNTKVGFYERCNYGSL